MIMNFAYAGKVHYFDTDKPVDISLPLRAGKENPNCYYAEPVLYETISAGDFIGSVAQGGSCNYQRVSFTPHGNGTHTECYGHISAEAEATVFRCLTTFCFFAQVVTCLPQRVGAGKEVDEIITLASLQPHITLPTQALLIRTPNEAGKRTKQYSSTNPPYLEEAVGKFLAENDIKHLLVDLPSVDRESDGGKLLTHHAFWQYPAQTRRDCTITELIYIPDEVPDGFYMLHLQVPSFELDAVPSKPVLYALTDF